jgi:hypothetical protein
MVSKRTAFRQTILALVAVFLQTNTRDLAGKWPTLLRKTTDPGKGLPTFSHTSQFTGGQAVTNLVVADRTGQKLEEGVSIYFLRQMKVGRMMAETLLTAPVAIHVSLNAERFASRHVLGMITQEICDRIYGGYGTTYALMDGEIPLYDITVNPPEPVGGYIGWSLQGPASWNDVSLAVESFSHQVLELDFHYRQ